MRFISTGCAIVVFLLLAAGQLVAQDIGGSLSGADPYTPQKLATGTLKFSGSRTMSQLVAVWADGFRHLHPGVQAKLDFKGSDTAFQNLGEGSSIGLLSRELTAADKESFSKTHSGLKLIEVDTAFDAIAVVVHPENPVHGLSLPQLKLLFGKNEQSDGLTWGKLRLEGDWADLPVKRFSPDEGSGTRGQFFARVLGPQEQPASVTPHAWHAKVAEEVAANRGGIGFMSYANSRVKSVRTVPLSVVEGGAAIAPNPNSIAAGVYPLNRPLSLIVVANDDGVKDPLVAEFVRYVLSQNGQDDVVKDGFQPLNRSALHEQFHRLGWNKLK